MIDEVLPDEILGDCIRWMMSGDLPEGVPSGSITIDDARCMIVGITWSTEFGYYRSFIDSIATEKRDAVERIIFRVSLKSFVDDLCSGDGSVALDEVRSSSVHRGLRAKLIDVLDEKELAMLDRYPDEDFKRSETGTMREVLNFFDREATLSDTAKEQIAATLADKRSDVLERSRLENREFDENLFVRAHEDALRELSELLTGEEYEFAKRFVQRMLGPD